MEVVEVVIDESSVGAFPFGNVRQEAASAEQIDECSRIGKPGQCFPELADKTAFLPLERQRGFLPVLSGRQRKTLKDALPQSVSAQHGITP